MGDVIVQKVSTSRGNVTVKYENRGPTDVKYTTRCLLNFFYHMYKKSKLSETCQII